MAWSTRRLAELAGTSVKTVRHYHAIGLLSEPERAGNGYKQYGTFHLVRLLQIKRLRDLGMSLADVAGMENSPDDFDNTVRRLDIELAESIERLKAVRTELADLMRHRSGPDVPAGFESVADSLTDSDRAMMTVTAQLFDEGTMRAVQDIAANHQEADAAFNSLTADAGDDAVRTVAEYLVPVLRAIRERYPDAFDPRPVRGRERDAVEAMGQAIVDLYNPAQIEVMRQAYQLVQEGRTGM